MSQQGKKQAKQFDDYDSGNGPRPPVPGEESKMSKMTTEGGAEAPATATIASLPGTSAATNRSPPPPHPPSQSPQPSTDSFEIRVSRWQQNLEYLLADQVGANLLLSFVRDGGDNSKHLNHVDFYFACEGLKFWNDINDMEKVRKVTGAIGDRYLASNIIEAPPELRKTTSQIKRNKIDPQPHIFDELQKKVERIIEKEVYPAFLKSDLFIEFVQRREDAATESDAETVNVADAQPLNYDSSCSGASGGAHSMVANASDGGGGGGAASTFSRINVDLISPLINTSNLQTLHEDSELKLNAKSHLMKPRTARPMPKLTEDLLLATQKGRLEVRPQGAVGYTYNVPFNSSYNPVSRQGSERQSCSSAGQTSDSEVNSKDGKPYIHRRPTPAEDYRKAHINPPTLSQKTLIKPLNQGLKESVEPISKSRMESSYPIDSKALFKKLEKIKREQDNMEHFIHSLSTKLNSAAQPKAAAAPHQPVHDQDNLLHKIKNMLTNTDVDEQSILDHHVSNVFSPRHTPGSTSPKNLQRPHHRSNEMSSSVPDFAMPSMRHSRSIPENASFGLSSIGQQPTRRTPHPPALYRCPSQNIDSGISLYSADIPYNKAKEMKTIEQFVDERRSTKDDSRRSRKQLPLPQQQLTSMSQPMLFQQSLSPIPASCSSSTSGHHTNSLARNAEFTNESHEHIFAHYKFNDESMPYRIKIPTKKVTLKLFKEHLPRKGNFRYFFQTTCDDLENPIVQEEVVNDADMVPIYDGKIIAQLRLMNE